MAPTAPRDLHWEESVADGVWTFRVRPRFSRRQGVRLFFAFFGLIVAAFGALGALRTFLVIFVPTVPLFVAVFVPKRPHVLRLGRQGLDLGTVSKAPHLEAIERFEAKVVDGPKRIDVLEVRLHEAPPVRIDFDMLDVVALRFVAKRMNAALEALRATTTYRE